MDDEKVEKSRGVKVAERLDTEGGKNNKPDVE